MKQFFKMMLASMTGFIIAGILLILIVIGIIVAQVSRLETEKEVKVKANTVLKLDLNDYLEERTNKNPFEMINFNSFESNKKAGLTDIIRSIQNAKDDPKVSGIYMEFTPSFYAGYAALEDLRNTIIDFKKSKKFVYAYGELYSEKAYYLASTADKIYMNPAGEMIFNGMASTITFFKGSLDKLGIEMEVFKVGKFKGAVEPFLLDKLSPENREQIDVYLSSLFNTYIDGIAKSRKMDAEQVRQIAEQMQIRSAQGAVDLKMIDQLAYQDEVMTAIRNQLGIDKKDEINFIAPYSYSKVNPTKAEGEGSSQGKIAILYAVGDIVDGNGDAETVGSASFREAIIKAREDKNVKAVVLRINSPGGSAMASDVILRELSLLKKEKPLIVSMGDVAASGGYYIAMAADTIVAQPNTITGSIGVFGMFPTMQKLLNDKLGITIDGVKKGEFADLGRVDRPLTEGERAIIQNYVNDVYVQFLNVVSKGRGMDTAAVHEIAQGRVWTGSDAKERGLVDVIGGLQTAIDLAAKKGGLTNYKIKELPIQKSPFEEILMGMSAETKAKFLQEELGQNYKYYLQMRRATRYQGIQTRMPFEVTID